MTWKCLNPDCGRTFPLVARISRETKDLSSMEPVRVVVDRACCPFCKSIDFEEVKS